MRLPVRLDQVMGDVDGDADVDVADFSSWTACMTGPDRGPHPAGCDPLDFDGDVDLHDHAAFQRAFSDP
ncbi:MAG: hypothetical protein ACE5E6_08925 [Phycisphaerae bacterium]